MKKNWSLWCILRQRKPNLQIPTADTKQNIELLCGTVARYWNIKHNRTQHFPRHHVAIRRSCIPCILYTCIVYIARSLAAWSKRCQGECNKCNTKQYSGVISSEEAGTARRSTLDARRSLAVALTDNALSFSLL